MIKQGTLIKSIWGTDCDDVYVIVSVTRNYYRYKRVDNNRWQGGVPKAHFKNYFEVVE